jgi:O-antigen/teichoic acid export membrane protein
LIRSLIKDTFIYGAAAIFSKGLMILLLPIYTRVLSTTDYGAYDLFVTIFVLANLIVAFEISQGLARFWVDEQDTRTRNCLASTALWFSVFMYGFFTATTLLFSSELNDWLLGDARFLDSFRLGVVFITFNGIYYLLLNQFRWELRSREYALISIAYALLTLISASVFCIWQDMGLRGVMLAQLFAALLTVLLSLWLLRRTFGLEFDANKLLGMLRFSSPLVPAGLAVFISLYLNRFALNHFGSLEDVGFFGVGSRIASLAALLILGIQAALMPMVYQHHRDPQTPRNIARIFGWFSGVALVGCLFLGVFASELLMLFATPKFMAGAELVIVLAPSLLISQMYIFAPGIAIAKKTHWQLWVTLFSAVVSIASNWILVPIWGIWGATLSAMLSSLVFFVSWLYLSQRLYWIPYDWRALTAASLAFVVCGSAGALLEQQGLDFVQSLLVKSALLIVLICTVVACGLIPLRDIYALWTQLKLRLVGSQHL